MTTIELPQLRISASQIETMLLCRRKWWLNSVKKVPQPQTTSQTFGDVLHSVLERWFKADDLGNDLNTGRPVDLYPPGWHVARNRFRPQEITGEITPAEQDVIKKLIVEAQQAGMLERRPERLIEQSFELDVLPPDHAKGFGAVRLIGYIDLDDDEGVKDHKSTKSMKWAKSPAALAQNAPMLIYAYEKLTRWRYNALSAPHIPPPEADDTILLRHNVFSKECKVRKVEAVVRVDYLDQFWKGMVEPIAADMRALASTVQSWDQIPDPPDRAQACNAYGGCPYIGICDRIETEEQYLVRLQRTKEIEKMLGRDVRLASGGEVSYTPSAPSHPTPPHIAGETVMPTGFSTFMERMNAGGTGSAPAASVPVNAPFAQSAAASPAPAAPMLTASSPGGIAAAIGAPTQFVNPMVPAGVAAPIAAPAAPVAPTAAPTAAPAAVAADPLGDKAPWAAPACPACAKINGGGFNKNGKPCRICVGMIQPRRAANPAESILAPELFDLVTPGDGTVIWAAKDGSDVGGVRKLSAATEAKSTAVEAPAPPPAASAPVAPAPAPAPAPAVAPAPVAPVAAPAPPEEPKEPKEPKKGGRPAKSFLLLVNVAQDISSSSKQGSGRYSYRLSKLLEEVVGPQCAQAYGVQHFMEVKVFDRRDWLRANGERFAAMFANDIVIADGIGTGESDLRALYDGIRPYAGDAYFAAF